MKCGFKIGFRLVVIAFAVTGFIAGCATAVPIHTEASTSGIRAAEESGAAKIPQASLHLQLAKEELESAKNLAAKGEEKKANSMLMRSEADAELAVVLVHQDTEKTAALEAAKRAQELRNNN